MQQNEQLVGTLNELIRYNHDRIRGYERAIEELESQNMDLQAIFQDRMSQSREYVAELESLIGRYGGSPAEDSTISGKLYRVWMDFKATLTGHDRKSVLDSCVFGEKAALEAYDDALGTDSHLPDEVRRVIVRQKNDIESSLETIKTYAQMHERIS